ncbi:nucleoside recognition domain-containing protein [Paenibacillus physcomitrellae]|uniref:Sporulation integral membrane protein YlbJ n=1 Tax=Paenibacillus physcomitrellae TaxID=1619311 RepID=A0ABQ1GAX6_9BACL|nr:nucleoside recognition domain-containing protein [Paenibacillus physcomitrellae]GGA40123.1 sporulation integral membrane protein YlbJ [Paenibacillus physcomitrellae]
MNNTPETTPNSKGSLWTTFWLGLCAVILVVCVIYDPGKAFDATLQGLTVWWHIVFPALLPFLVLSEMMIAYGLVHGLGTLFDPLTRKLFRFPGESGFLLPLGLIAGFPVAAESAARLYGQQKLTAGQAARLSAAVHFCNPMLIVVVIGTGFMHTPALGLLLAAIHIVAGLAAGITIGWLRRPQDSDSPAPASKVKPAKSAAGSKDSLIRQVIRSTVMARRIDGRSFGRLLGDTVTVSVQTLLSVGGYMLIFALVIQVISRVLPKGFPDYIVPALLEVHLGSFRLAESGFSSPALQAALLGAGLGWGGLCSYFQVRAVLKPAGIHSKGFLLTRLLHGAYAYLFTLLIWNPVTALFPHTVPAYRDNLADFTAQTGTFLPQGQQFWGIISWQTVLFALILGGLTVFAFLWRRKMRHQV